MIVWDKEPYRPLSAEKMDGGGEPPRLATEKWQQSMRSDFSRRPVWLKPKLNTSIEKNMIDMDRQ